MFYKVYKVLTKFTKFIPSSLRFYKAFKVGTKFTKFYTDFMKFAKFYNRLPSLQSLQYFNTVYKVLNNFQSLPSLQRFYH